MSTATPISPSDSSSAVPGAQLDATTFTTNAWRPSTDVGAYRIGKVEGEIPRELHGTLYRNGPSQKQLPPEGHQALHLFDGDGMVHAFRFDDGVADYTGRWVENPCYQIEERDQAFRMNAIGVKAENPTDEVFLREAHNTNVVHHAGRLLALVENAPPFQIDAKTLAPMGHWDLDGKMVGMSVSAHPKIDGKTGQMVWHGYQPFEPYGQVYVIEADGQVSMAEGLDLPYSTMMHDFAITENYIIFLLTPVLLSPAIVEGEITFTEALSCELERGLKFGVRRREPGSEIRWFDAPTPGFIFHPGNAYEDGDKIVMDACTYLDPAALLTSLSTIRSGVLAPTFSANPFLYELDLKTGACTERQLDDRGAEFPRLDDRLTGYRNRFGYAALNRGADDEPGGIWSTLVRYDRTGGPNAIHDFGQWTWPSEPVFVPRTADSPEEDGFVLTVVYDGLADSSYLAVLDAQNMAAPPLAKCHLEHRIPMGFHGNFAAGVL